MNDFETNLKQSLNQSVDAQLGARRTPPPFQPVPEEITRRHGIRPWIAPLVAAACVAAALIVTLTTTSALSGNRATSPASPAPSTPASPTPTATVTETPTSEAPTPTASSASATSPSSTPSATPSPTPTPSPTVVRLADASIWLPAGWGAVDSHAYPYGSGRYTKWCIGPADQPGGITCRVWLERSVQSANSGGGYDSDVPGAGPGADPSICGSSVQPTYSVLDAGDRDFGGRTADYRVFRWSCSGGPAQIYVKYLIPAGPAFNLYALDADGALQATMADIVRNSTLPAQTSALRYYDFGYVRSLIAVSGGYQLAIDRVMAGPHGLINNNPQTYQYFEPTDWWGVFSHHPAVGDLVVINTDGTHATWIYKYSP